MDKSLSVFKTAVIPPTFCTTCDSSLQMKQCKLNITCDLRSDRQDYEERDPPLPPTRPKRKMCLIFLTAKS